MRLLSAATVALIGATRNKTFAAFTWYPVSSVRVAGQPDDYQRASGVSIFGRMAPLNMDRNSDLALRFKDEKRALFKFATKDELSITVRDEIEDGTGQAFEVLSIEDVPNGATVRYFIVAEVVTV